MAAAISFSLPDASVEMVCASAMSQVVIKMRGVHLLFLGLAGLTELFFLVSASISSLEFCSCKSSPESCSYLLFFSLGLLGVGSMMAAELSTISGLTALVPSCMPQQASLTVLTKQSRISMTSTPPSPQKSRSQVVMQSGLNLKRQQMARKRASPRTQTILYMTGYLKSALSACRRGQMINAIMTSQRKLMSWQWTQQATSTAVESSRRQSRHYSHLTHTLSFYFWMHFFTSSCSRGNTVSTPRTTAGGSKVVRSMGEQTRLSRVTVEEQARGTQNHLMQPLRAMKAGSYSTGLQHLRKEMNTKISSNSATSTAAKDRGKPLEHTKSPLVQKTSRFLLKLIMAVVRQLEKAAVFITEAKRKDICRNQSPRKYCLKKSGSRGAIERATMEKTMAAVLQQSLMTVIQ